MARKPQQQSIILGSMGRVFLSWRRYLQRHVAKAGCSIQQYHVLRQLRRRDCLRPSDIAAMLFCDRPTASVVIHNLRAAGWVSVMPDPANGKQRQVRITEEGVRILTAAEALLSEVRAAFDPISCLTDDEARQLSGLLRKM